MAQPIIYLNGKFIPRDQATLDIEDRGALFADGVYEVVRYYAGRSRAIDKHLARLHHSLESIGIARNAQIDSLIEVSDALVAQNNLPDAKLYWQVTRGSAPRDHIYPRNVSPTVMAIAYPGTPLEPDAPAKAVKCILLDDERWHNCNIKSLMLLPNVIAKNKAADAGAYEAILHRAGIVTEGCATSLFIVRKDGIWTHPEGRWILPGVTRSMVIDLAIGLGIKVHEASYAVDELLAADEVFLTGTTTHVAGVVAIDDVVIGDGKVGPVTAKLQAAFLQEVVRTCLKR